MKKARIVLTLILLFGLIGGGLAYNVNAKNKDNSIIVYYITHVLGANATVTYDHASVTISGQGSFYYFTLVFNTPAGWTGWLIKIAI